MSGGQVTNTQRAAMQQALKAIHTGNNQDMVDAQDSLRAALAEPVVEPVVTDEENELFSEDVSNFAGADPEATKHALVQFLKRRSPPPQAQQPPPFGRKDRAA